MALELTGDVAEVYAAADERTKRDYNQAFFTKLYITPEWDESQGQIIVRVARAELTEPYAALRPRSLCQQVTKGAKLVRSNAHNRGSGLIEPLPAAAFSIYLKLAGCAGRLSKHGPAWRRISELHAQRFGKRRDLNSSVE